MPRRAFFFAILLGASVPLLLFIPGAWAAVLISEVQITGGAGHSDDDFVELYNAGTGAEDLSGYRLRIKNGSGAESSLRVLPDGACIPSHGYYLWANSRGAYSSEADTVSGNGLAANYSLALFPPEGALPLDSLSWGGSAHPFENSAFSSASNPGAGQSLVRDLGNGEWESLFSVSPSPTGSTGCGALPPQEVPSAGSGKISPSVRFEELFPNPAGPDTDEFIELYNFGTDTLDLSGFVIRDASQTGKYILPAATAVEAGNYLTFFRSVSKLSLNNADEQLTLFDSQENVLDVARYGKSREGVSLNFRGGKWYGGIPTPGMPNAINEPPVAKAKIPKDAYRGIPAAFDARGKDPEHDHLKYVWDFGDGHKSYKAATVHTFLKNGSYAITLTVTDGRGDTTETFALKVRSYEPPKVRITALLPNPSGRDMGNEWLLIKNETRKAVNLRDWSIATGATAKHMVNHPIRYDFVVDPGKEEKLLRTAALFVLGNAKGRIELRSPDKKTVQTIRYQASGKSVPEGMLYIKAKGSPWRWQGATAPLPGASRAVVVPASPEKREAEATTPSPLLSQSERNERYAALRDLALSLPIASFAYEPEMETRGRGEVGGTWSEEANAFLGHIRRNGLSPVRKEAVRGLREITIDRSHRKALSEAGFPIPSLSEREPPLQNAVRALDTLRRTRELSPGP